MLPRARRLSRAAIAGLSRGKRLDTEHFRLSLSPRAGGGSAVVVPKKVAMRAVDRHLLKRRVLAVLKEQEIRDTAVVVTAKSGSPSLPFATLSRELKAAFDTLRH